MQQQLKIVYIDRTSGFNAKGGIEHMTTYTAKSVSSNGIDLHLQITVKDTEKREDSLAFIKNYLGSNGDLEVGSIIQVNFKHRFQKNSSEKSEPE